MTTQAIIARQTGPPSVLELETINLPDPGAGEVRLRHTAIGVNFIDTYFRKGLYPWPGEMPIIVGSEAAGVVEEVGAGVEDLRPGDRVAYFSSGGAYARHRNFPADRLLRLPHELPAGLVAATLLKGMTVQYLLERTFPVEPGHTLLFHAAAGGVGLLAGQWAAHLGATVIGTVGSEAKMELARAHGYHHVINYQEEDFVEKTLELTDGRGVHVVYDSVGQDTYPASLRCLRRLGTWVPFGQSSGPIQNFELQHLAQHGSLFTTRPSLFDYVAEREDLEASAGRLFDMLENGHLRAEVGQRFPLEEAARVHRLLESRQTKGSTVLLP